MSLARLRRRLNVWNLILAVALATIGLLVLYPMGSIFYASFLDPETSALSLDSYHKIFTRPFYLRCLGNSLTVSGLATLASLLIGIPFAYLTARVRLPGAAILRTLATLPLVLPTFIGAEAWLLLLGRNGILTRLLREVGIGLPSIYGWPGIVLHCRPAGSRILASRVFR